MYMTAEGKAIKEAYQWEAKNQWKRPPLADALGLSVRFFFKTKRRRDLDNQNKLILDALSGIVYEDDSQICVLHLYRGYDAANPRIEIDVLPGEVGLPIVARAVGKGAPQRLDKGNSESQKRWSPGKSRDPSPTLSSPRTKT